jgi:hypothetical protein
MGPISGRAPACESVASTPVGYLSHQPGSTGLAENVRVQLTLHGPIRRGFGPAALIAICAVAMGAGGATEPGAASASSVGVEGAGAPIEPGDVSLQLSVHPIPEVRKPADIRAQGFTDVAVTLWVYEDPRGGGCAATPAARRFRTRTVIEGLQVEGAFDETRRLKMRNPGLHTFCAYLSPDPNSAWTITAIESRVRSPLLRARRARATVPAALKRHGFADRVLGNLENRCRRRTRSKFSCRFSSAFPGYSLTGSGSVELRKRLNYRFTVFAQGRALTLTNENEGHFPG